MRDRPYIKCTDLSIELKLLAIFIYPIGLSSLFLGIYIRCSRQKVRDPDSWWFQALGFFLFYHPSQPRTEQLTFLFPTVNSPSYRNDSPILWYPPSPSLPTSCQSRIILFTGVFFLMIQFGLSLVVALTHSSNDYYAVLIASILILKMLWVVYFQPYQKERWNYAQLVADVCCLLLFFNALLYSSNQFLIQTRTPDIFYFIVNVLCFIYFSGVFLSTDPRFKKWWNFKCC